jgi:hypothetical protein
MDLMAAIFQQETMTAVEIQAPRYSHIMGENGKILTVAKVK